MPAYCQLPYLDAASSIILTFIPIYCGGYPQTAIRRPYSVMDKNGLRFASSFLGAYPQTAKRRRNYTETT